MLTIKTIKNPLITDKTKDGFCFRSSCSQTLSLNKLAEEMKDWNSSFTEADYLGMFSVMENIVKKFLAKGYNVELPFGNVRVNVTGTCANIQDSFVVGSGNHSLGLLFTANSNVITDIGANLEFKQLLPDITTEVKLYRITSLLADANESSELSVQVGKILRLHGRNLSFDIADENQGVFMENETGVTRVESYIRRGTNVVDFFVPSSAASGSYSISVVTKPGNTYFTATIDSEITVL